MLTFNKNKPGTYDCVLDLGKLYLSNFELKQFDDKWPTFINSDPWNEKVIKRINNKIYYQHKSWVPEKVDDRKPLLILAGNPAPQSTYEDVYYAFEINGSEHRFWKVLRKLDYIDLTFDLEKMKSNFFDLNYDSPFRLGIDVIFSFPSSVSTPAWSGVQGLKKLFGKKAFDKMFDIEKRRLHDLIQRFFVNSQATIIAMQKDAYNSIAQNEYSQHKAVEGKLSSQYTLNCFSYAVYGTPPTRWLYTKKMQSVLTKIRKKILR